MSRGKLPPGSLGAAGNGLKLFNEKYFEDFFSGKRYEVIYPETLSVAKQISLISNADEVASSLGTLAHFALFCRPGTKFTMLTRMDNIVLPTQCMVNFMSKVDWYIVDVTMSFLNQSHNAEPVLMGETKYWKQYVKQMYGEEVTTETWRDFIDDYVQFYCQYHNLQHFAPNIIKIFNRSYELLSEKIF